MNRGPNFDELFGPEVQEDERERLRAAHDLLVQAGPPPELSPELESVPWPEEALAPVWRRSRPRARRRLVAAAVLVTVFVAGLLLGRSGTSNTTSISAVQTVMLRGTSLDRSALATLELGKRDAKGNWPMVLRVSGLPRLSKDGYYDLYLTRNGKPLVSCGTFNVNGKTVVRLSAAYNLERFDRNGWVIVRKTPGHFEPTQIVLSASV